MSNTLIAAIGSIGFPIVMCLLFFFGLKKSIDNNTSAINNMKITMQQLCDCLSYQKQKGVN
jgi:hypothetical protein